MLKTAETRNRVDPGKPSNDNKTIAQEQSTGNRLSQLSIENEQYTDINGRCVQIQNVLKNIAAMFFVIIVSLGAFILIAALEEASTLHELLAMFGLEKWLVKR